MHAVKENKIVTGTKTNGSFFGKAPGNSFFAPAVVQPKLTIGPVDDPYEREADTVADRVMRMTDAEVQQSQPVAVQRKCAECEKEEQLQKKEDNDFITSTAGKNIQRSPGDNDTTPGNEESNQATPFLRIRITLHDLYDREDNDMANYGEANIEMIRRGVIFPGDYTVPYSALWNNNYQLSTRWGLGRITKNLYEKGDNLLKPIRGIVGKIPLAGGFISSKIKLSKPDLKGGDWDRYIADKTTLTALGGALDRDNPAYNAGSGFTFTINIVDFHFDENRLFRKPVNSNYTPLFQINRKCAQCEEEDKKAQMKSEAAGSGGITAPSIVHNVINRNGQPLDAATRNFMESRMGFDFGNVQIHNDSEAHQSSSAIHALAYTSGNHIAFGTGQYQPDSIEGRKLLAHELTHVIQQSGRRSIIQKNEAPKYYTYTTQDYIDQVTEALTERNTIAGVGNPPKAYDILSSIESTDQLKDVLNGLGEYNLDVLAPLSGDSRVKMYVLATRIMLMSKGNIRLQDIDEVLNSYGILDDNMKADIVKTMRTNPDANDLINKKYTQKVVQELDTDLNGLSVGNFDFTYSSCNVRVSVRVKFDFDSSISSKNRVAYKKRFLNAVNSMWDNKYKMTSADQACSCKIIPIRISVIETTANDEHKVVDVHNENDYREKVIDEINLDYSSSDTTMAHEFGHVLGLYDEYDGGWLENKMFWHDTRYIKDKAALMNEGTELRARYFLSYLWEVQKASAADCNYKLEKA